MKYANELYFCAKFLQERGFLEPERLEELIKDLPKFHKKYIFVEDNESFYTQLAEQLRELWPQGEKDGKYPWRDSVKNISIRLQFLWKERALGTKYSIDDCLVAARKYLSQYEDNVKYMKILKYFIFKQKKIVSKEDGKITYTYQSDFADILEAQTPGIGLAQEEFIGGELR